jgi:hypothetical protein
MANHLLNIHVKNMTGDLVTVSIPSGLTAEEGLEEVRQELFRLDSTAYPPLLTKLIRLEETGPLVNDEVVCLFVPESAKLETVSVFDLDATRMVIPLNDKIVYVYRVNTRIRPSYYPFFIASFSPDVEDIKDRLKDWPEYAKNGRNLSDFNVRPRNNEEIMASFRAKTGEEPLISRGKYKPFYSILYWAPIYHTMTEALDYIELTATKDRREVYRRACELDYSVRRFLASPEERIECECGAVVRSVELSSHVKKKAHKDYLKKNPSAME